MTKERVFLRELARYLHHKPQELRRFAKQHGYLRRARGISPIKLIEYVSPYAAQRIIAHIRAIQGEEYLWGQDFHQHRETEARAQLRMIAKRKALGLPRRR